MEPLYPFLLPGQDPFYKELKEKVYTYFSEKKISIKASKAMWFKIVFMLSGMTACYLMILSGYLTKPQMLITSIALGIFVAGVGCNVAHDALHGTFSKKKWINQLLGYSMDLLGSNSYLWKINHNNHHFYTNITGLDGDIRENSLIRFSPLHPDKKTYRFQAVSLFFVYGAFLLLVIWSFNFMHIFRNSSQTNVPQKHPAKEIIKLLVLKIVYLFVWIVVPLYFIPLSPGEFIAGYLAMNFTAGYLLAFNFMAPHNFEEAHYAIPPGKSNTSWAAHQLYTTANFKTWNKPMEYFIGGLNFQIEHHLFPQICSIHYPRISHIVRATALKYDLPYHEKRNFSSMITSHLKRLNLNAEIQSD
jgi:linoleoyl-CoA desaturase